MKRVLLSICLFTLAGTSLAGFSIGFNQTDIPWMVSASGADIYLEDMYLLRFGAMFSPDFRAEAYLGYEKQSWELDPQPVTPVEPNGSGTVFGAGGYYVMEAPANTSFSIGLRFLYGSVNVEDGIYEFETTSYAIDPLMRIDFAIPGAEQLALFTEYGARYVKATTKTTVSGVASTTDDVFSGLWTYAPPNVLAGIYYVF